MLNGLNHEQIEAVKSINGYICVIASAGSGKTKTLTTRVSYLIKNNYAKPNEILSLTFTNKAANEMKERVEKILNNKYQCNYMLTFHSLCNRILKENYELLNFNKKYVIISEQKQKNAIKKISEILNLDFSEEEVLNIIENVIGKGCKNENRTIIKNYEEILINCSAEEIFKEIKLTTNIDKIILLYYLYYQKLYSFLDYEDLINFTIYFMNTKKEIKNKWQNKFKFIQIDEFQDVSDREMDIALLLSEKNNNLFVVGDPDQMIYGWRGANINQIINFEKTMLLHNKKNIKTIFLTQNYRSTKEIINISNVLIKNNKNRITKNIVATKNCGDKAYYFFARNEKEEAKWVIERIKEMKDRNLSDFAILYRNYFVAQDIIEKLNENNLPFEIINEKENTKYTNSIKLSTIHSSKGLEFPIVFVIGVNEGVIPDEKAKTPEEIEEERRLFYVAMTRAEEKLFLSGVGHFSEEPTFRNRKYISRFLKELDEDLINSTIKLKGKEFSVKNISNNIFEENEYVRNKTLGTGIVVKDCGNSCLVDFDGIKLNIGKNKLKKVER